MVHTPLNCGLNTLTSVYYCETLKALQRHVHNMVSRRIINSEGFVVYWLICRMYTLLFSIFVYNVHNFTAIPGDVFNNRSTRGLYASLLYVYSGNCNIWFFVKTAINRWRNTRTRETNPIASPPLFTTIT